MKTKLRKEIAKLLNERVDFADWCGVDEYGEVMAKEILTLFHKTIKELRVEKPTGDPARFSYHDEWYEGYNRAISDAQEVVKGTK